MSIRSQELVCTTDASGAGTATTALPVNGELIAVCNDGTAWGGTVDYNLLRAGGGTVATLTNQAGPFTAYPAGSAIGFGTAAVPIPVEGYLELRVAQATVSTGGTVQILYRQ